MLHASQYWDLKDDSYIELRRDMCMITIEPCPHYCDRGNFVANVYPLVHHLKGGPHIDDADGWPRYYFLERNAKEECEAWMKKRNLWTQKKDLQATLKIKLLREIKLRAIAKRIYDDGIQCNCDLDNWEPEKDSGHSCVCRIDKMARAELVKK